jgi:glycosyltransferase involved in cell wall biosynthesis
MVGSGELYEEIKKEASILNISSHVKLIGYVDHHTLKLYYDAADLLVLPSVTEALGNVLLEAMAFGLPIIASNTGACPEIVGDAGILFKQGDYNDLSEKIMTMKYDKELLKKLGDTGLMRVKNVFTWKEKINQYLNLYNTLISREKR